MSEFTAAYLARLELWGGAALLVHGLLVLASWRAWQRAVATPQARHRLACAHFAALGLLPLATLAIVQAGVAARVALPPQGPPVAALPSPFDGVVDLAAAVVAAAWLAGVVVMLLRLALDARALARVRHAPAPAHLVAAVRRAARASAVAPPTVREADVASPQVAGWRRPRLLVPSGLARDLTPAELDAVLLHELAHVRRRDLSWNLLQRGVLALLWFHPVAWVLQAAVARERERCCDALALRHGAAATALARALVKLAEHGLRGPVLVMAVADRGGLVERVRDLLEPERRGPARSRSLAGAVALGALCMVALGAGRAVSVDPALGDFYLASAFGPTLAIDAHDAAGAFALQVRQGRVLQASVQQRPVRVVQEGERVTLTALADSARSPLLVLTVTPQGRVQWEGRR